MWNGGESIRKKTNQQKPFELEHYGRMLQGNRRNMWMPLLQSSQKLVFGLQAVIDWSVNVNVSAAMRFQKHISDWIFKAWFHIEQLHRMLLVRIQDHMTTSHMFAVGVLACCSQEKASALTAKRPWVSSAHVCICMRMHRYIH